MSTLQNILKKYDSASSKVNASEGRTGDLPKGPYLVQVTKGTIWQSDGGAVFVNWMTQVTEGEHTGRSQRVSQNIIKSDGSLNDVGVSIVKGTFQRMFGKERVPNNTTVAKFEKLAADSAGQVLKIKVGEEAANGYANVSISAVMGASVDVSSTIAAGEVPEPEQKESKKTRVVTTDASHETFDIQAHLQSLNRDELKAFVIENAEVDAAMMARFGSKCKKAWSDDELRDNIYEVTKPVEAAVATDAASDED